MKPERSLVAVPDPGVRKPKLSAHGVSKTFRNARGDVVSALGEVNLDIAEGEFVCLIGPSGCGKTTLLNLFAGLDRPDTGGIGWTAAGHGPGPTARCCSRTPPCSRG